MGNQTSKFVKSSNRSVCPESVEELISNNHAFIPADIVSKQLLLEKSLPLISESKESARNDKKNSRDNPPQIISMHDEKSMDEDFQNLDIQLQDELELSINMNDTLPDSIKENTKLSADLKNALSQIELLKKEIEDLNDSKADIRNQLVNARKSFVTSFSDESSVSVEKLQEQIINARRAHEEYVFESEKRLSKYKNKFNRLRTESAVRIFELEEKLKESKRIPTSLNGLKPLPDMLLPPISYDTSVVDNLKSQLESKNQLILDLSMKILEYKNMPQLDHIQGADDDSFNIEIANAAES